MDWKDLAWIGKCGGKFVERHGFEGRSHEGRRRRIIILYVKHLFYT
jgi:hypothetical protein